ncbi:ribonuclease H-like domain-containing protein [Mycena leptocephala]|nr:ribonuclease H-like domain-containing protein [Mycena leptocephala]
MGWVELPAGKYQLVDEAGSLSHNQTEVTIKREDIIVHGVERQIRNSAPLKILSFDIETNVQVDNSFTQYHQTAKMPVIQIGNFSRTYRIIFTLGGCADIPRTEVNSFEDEAEMLSAWRQFIIESDPELIIGHNIGRFDFIYLILRAEALGLSDFPCLGRLKGVNAVALKVNPGDRRRWTDAPVLAGRLQLDTCQYLEEMDYRNGVRRSHRLDDVSDRYLNSRKEDLDFKRINALQAGTDDDRKKIAVYCLKDSYLPLRLLDCEKLRCLDEAITAAQTQKYIHLPFGDFLRVGRNMNKPIVRISSLSRIPVVS